MALAKLQPGRGRSDLILWCNFTYAGIYTWAIGQGIPYGQRSHSNVMGVYTNRPTGWTWWRANWLDAWIDWAKAGGFWPRIWVHWPFGRDDIPPNPDAYDMNAWTTCGDQIPDLIADFVSVMSGLRNEGYQVTCYLDGPRYDPNFQELDDEGEELAYEALFNDAHVGTDQVGGVMWDAVGGTGDDPPSITADHPFMAPALKKLPILHAQGDLCGVETIPRAIHTHLHVFDHCTLEDTFQNRGLWAEGYQDGQASTYPKFLRDHRRWAIVFNSMVVDSWDPFADDVECIRISGMERDAQWGGDYTDAASIESKGREVLGDGHIWAIDPRIPINAGAQARNFIPESTGVGWLGSNRPSRKPTSAMSQKTKVSSLRATGGRGSVGAVRGVRPLGPSK